MKFKINRLVILSVFLVSTGCTTLVTSEKATEINEGIRYWLPAPHLVVIPQSNGTVTVETIMLPDPQHEYVIDVWSIFSDYKIQVTKVDGLLTAVNLSETSVDSAATSIGKATEIGKTLITNAQTRAKERKAEQKTVQDAQLALDEANIKLELMRTPPSGVTITSQQIFDQELEIRTLQLALKKLTGSTENNPPVAGNTPNAIAVVNNGFEDVPGPILFRILPNGEGVKLVAVGQEVLKVIGSDSVQATDLVLTPTGIISVVPSGNENEPKKLLVTLTSNLELDEININETQLKKESDLTLAIAKGSDIPVIIKNNDSNKRKILVFTLPIDTKSGKYRLSFEIKPIGSEEREVDVRLSVTGEN